MANDTVGRTFLVAFLVCFVCSLLVSGTTAGLRAKKERDALVRHYGDVLAVTGLMNSTDDVYEFWQAHVDPRLVELATGSYSDAFDPEAFNQERAARDPSLNRTIPADLDSAGLRTRSRFAPVYLIRQEGEVRQVVLPVHGKGLWSTMYGYIALQPDLRTVAGFGFHEHGETPGLGGEVDNPQWLAQWPGKVVFDDKGEVRIEVLRGQVDEDSAKARYQVDGISGATMTTRGVTNLLRYWLGPDGFGPYLERLRQEGFNG
ncbi:Na(+)-translocating NADH-quinone reductase subunit C [Desulfuromonas sp. AOP6]|uniref:Na(+)-translocating NADH-quinone reductase subunit C n=1 Tax=Desulfuromonas sp. AOP6 TaxID=1566351 RepID=UPI00127E2E99|nr:Na(+)-translocating NADH-quinone reductase subunit C [Desulfuromonas sp. AOP6]BCA78934.1 Na (+)-translocating NADH-quinone reductase subunit C [Desulfuromonas sp. AOP6]